MTPLQIRHIRLGRASADDARWLSDQINEISRAFGTRVTLTQHGVLRWRENDAAA
jgi:poly-gamma-glutamate synthesis protein (capsule biosynthesis protein)